LPQTIDVKLFLSVTQPPLQAGDPDALAAEVSRRWTPRQLCPLLGHQDAQVRRVVAVTLGFVGDRSVVGCLGRALHDPDELVTRMAEHGLWAIWFRLCSPAAAEAFQRGVCLLSEEQFKPALRELTASSAIDPDFAEAHNQIAIVHYLQGRYRRSIEHCHQTLSRMPNHFGALAGMGHCHAQLGEYRQAIHAYDRALAVHPRMPAIREALAQLRSNQSAQALATDAANMASPDDTAVPFFRP
jgi:tetratricopeptide (TPR) repeat protein